MNQITMNSSERGGRFGRGRDEKDEYYRDRGRRDSVGGRRHFEEEEQEEEEEEETIPTTTAVPVSRRKL